MYGTVYDYHLAPRQGRGCAQLESSDRLNVRNAGGGHSVSDGDLFPYFLYVYPQCTP